MIQEHNQEPVESPCNNQCKLDADITFCHSCFRTIEEIYTWHQFSDDERRAVLNTIVQRRQELKS